MLDELRKREIVEEIAAIIDPEPFGYYDYPLSQREAEKRKTAARAKAHIILKVIEKDEK